MIKIICVGKLKEKYLTDGVNDYLTRLRKYHKIELIELPDSNIDSEGDAIIKHIANKDGKVCLSSDAHSKDSLCFDFENQINHLKELGIEEITKIK